MKNQEEFKKSAEPLPSNKVFYLHDLGNPDYTLNVEAISNIVPTAKINVGGEERTAIVGVLAHYPKEECGQYILKIPEIGVWGPGDTYREALNELQGDIIDAFNSLNEWPKEQLALDLQVLIDKLNKLITKKERNPEPEKVLIPG